MKRYYILLAFTMAVTATVWGRQRSLSDAEGIALGAMRKTAVAKGRSLKGGMVTRVKTLRSSEILLGRPEVTPAHEVFYLFMPAEDTAEGGGFVLVSADDRMPDILGVADEGTFVPDDIPENMMCMLQDYAEALSLIEKGTTSKEAVFYPRSTEEVVVEPLLGGIKYNQGSPFNGKCPIRPTTKTRAVTGCVATAMAQVMRYHCWPTDWCKGSVNYTSKENKDTVEVSYDFSKLKFDWVNIMESYSKKGTEYAGGDTLTAADSMNFYALYRQYLSTGYNIKVDSLVVVNSAENFSGTVQYVLADSAGKFLQPIGQAKTMPSERYGKNTRVLTFTFSMPGTFPDGNYRFYLASKEKGSNEWSYIRKATDFAQWYDTGTHVENYIPVVKEGDRYYIDGKEFVCEYTDTAADAVAELMAACGASVKMQYSSSSSASTSSIVSAGSTYFNYDKDALYISQNYLNTDGWHKCLQKELLAARPVIYRGANDNGGGHAFVLDGLKYTNGVPYYHVNWGWGGSSNGYFLVTMLKPSEAGTGGSTSNYAHDNGMILNFHKDDGVNEYHLGCRGMSVDTTYIMPGDKITATVESMINLGGTSFPGQMNMVLKDSEGKMYNMGNCYSTSGLAYNHYFTSSKTVTYTVPTSMPLGDYTLTMYGIPSDGAECEVYNAHEITIHVVAENPATAMPGMLRYVFDNENKVAKVRRFSLSTPANAQKYYGDIVIPDTVEYQGVRYEVTAIGDSAFMGCTNVTSVVMSDHITSVGAHAFNGCTALTSVVYPIEFKGGVKDYTFNGCTALETLNLPDSIATIAGYAFTGCGVKSLTLPKGVTSIAARAFYDNNSLKEIILPEGLTSVGIYAFRYCVALEHVVIPSTWVKILNYTFQGCTSLKTVEMPATVTSIGGSAFKDCSSMEYIRLYGTTPASLGAKAFDETNNCPIYVPMEVVEAYKTQWSAYSARIVGELGTGIKQIAAPQDGSGDGASYTLDGVKVATPVKGGVYIINGKKVLVR